MLWISARTLSAILLSAILAPGVVNAQERNFLGAPRTIRGGTVEGTKPLLVDNNGDVASRDSSVPSRPSIIIPVPNADEGRTEKITYTCGNDVVAVEYIDAGRISLATLSMKDEFIVAANVLAASGARYAGNRFIWWTKGNQADLYDLTKGEDAAPVHCQKAQ